MSEPSNTLAEVTEELASMLRAPVDPRSLPVRFSRLKHMSLSPAHYYAACQRDESEQTLAMRLGSGVHAIVLGQPVERYSGRRAGADWKKFQADHPGALILNDREWYEASAMASSILRHREACAILLDGTEIERHLEWSYLGRACSSRFDARGPYHLAELKTAQTSNPRLFIREAIRMHYHGQCAFYDQATRTERGEGFSNVYLIAVEKSQPHPVTVYRLTERVLDLGRQTNRLWMEQLLACEASNEWPAYSDAIVDLDAPEIEGPIEIEIDGRTAEVF